MSENAIDLRHSYGNNRRLWVVSPDLDAHLNEAPNIAEYKPSPNGFFNVSNSAIYLTCFIHDSKLQRLYLAFRETMPRFEFSSEKINTDGKTALPNCDSIEIHCGTNGLQTFPGAGISDTVNILKETGEDPADYQVKGKPEWFELGTRLLEMALQKYHIDELCARYSAELPELKAKQEREDKERTEKTKPKGLIARLFG